MPGWFGVCLVAGTAALGALATAATGAGPGTALGVCVLLATLAAAFAVRPRAACLLIPVPALAYVVAAAVAGLARGHAAAVSRTALAVSAAQWAASGFLAMAAATAAAIAITAVRWRKTPSR